MVGKHRRRRYYVIPAIVEAENDYEIVQEETFVPILYLLKYRTEEEAIVMLIMGKQGRVQPCLR